VRELAINILSYAAVALAVLMAWLYLMQPRMVFYPLRGLQATPGDWGLPYEDVWLRSSDDVRLHGWYLPGPDSQRVLLFLHGNAGNISHRRDSLEIFHRLGLSVLIIDYRGYGGSSGSPDEVGLYQDAQAAWEYLTEQRGFAPSDVLLFGRSLGGAVATRLASRVAAGGLILESTFSSARDFAHQAFPLLSRVLVLRYRFDTAAMLRQVHCPVLVLHSPDDEIMPYALGERVYAAANPPKTFVALHGNHNEGFMLSRPTYEQALAEFIAQTATSP
jgi:pimeloyl-ACP methyl ester carboxylesterase